MSVRPRPGPIVLTDAPRNAETQLARLDGAIVPADELYVRNHFEVPRLDPARWRLRVANGAEESAFSLADLRALPQREITVTLECAGNGRRALDPAPEGVPWSWGAVGTARFRGVSLAHVLERAGASAAGHELSFEGADRAEAAPGAPPPAEGVEPYRRSLPSEAALDPDTILAWEMNGAPLAPDHGAPLRLVVPGWYGMASVKWLVRIGVLDAPFHGHFQSEDYRYEGEAGTPEGAAVTRVRVRSLIARPGEEERIPRAPIEIAGSAWSGEGTIERVEVSTDGGATWSDSTLGTPLSPHAAVPWRLAWTPARTGEHVLISRASDSAGHRQPLEPVWNRGGYGNNGVQRVRVIVS